MSESETMEIVHLPHEFENEVWCLVTDNYSITMHGIDQQEKALIDHMRSELAQEDDEVIRSQVSSTQFFFDRLRRAATHQALVALVTRLDHWTRKLVRRLSVKPDRDSQPVVRDIEALNKRLGLAPTDVGFFRELVNVRDSIIHADSQPEWEFPKGNTRSVATKYLDSAGELDFNRQHLAEAVEKTTAQVKWYDERILELGA
jgi:hypothetical protein